MKKYFIITSVLFAFLLASCEEFLDVNTDPNNPVTVSPELILPVAQNYTASYAGAWEGTNVLGNLMMYNWTVSYGFSWYTDEFQYLVTTTFYDRLFDMAYSSTLKQYAALDGFGEEYNNYKAISMIMKAYHYQILVDLYGDIPYSEALLRGENPTPKYDGAQGVYQDLVVQLTAAIDMINVADANAASVAVENDDIMFAGDMLMWKQFANSLKVRIINRAKASFDVAAELAAITAEGSGYIGGDVMINPGYLNEENKQNPYWADFGASVDGTPTLTHNATCATQFMVDYLQLIFDPRIDYMYELPATGHMGGVQGETQLIDHHPDFVSNIGDGNLYGSTMSSTVFTHAEHLFNMAELALDGFGGDPQTFYEAGIQASFDYLGAGDASGYSGQPAQNVGYVISTNKLEAIITQKWLALNGVDAVQSWFDYSRTGYPANLPIAALATTADRPVRLFYPSSEVTANTANVPTQPNAFTSKIFWAN